MSCIGEDQDEETPFLRPGILLGYRVGWIVGDVAVVGWPHVLLRRCVRVLRSSLRHRLTCGL